MDPVLALVVFGVPLTAALIVIVRHAYLRDRRAYLERRSAPRELGTNSAAVDTGDATPVSRWTIKRDGPPSQKIAIWARRVARVGIGGGVIGGLLAPDSSGQIVALLAGITLFFVAYGVERREQRQGRLAETSGGRSRTVADRAR